MSDDQIIDGILRRELHPTEKSWNDSRARLHAADRGGWTRGGITAARWGQYTQLARPATPVELNAIAETEARAFYRTLYIDPFDGYPEPLRFLLIDYGVTSPHTYVFKALQQALRDMKLYAGSIDGVVGQKTRAAVAACTNHRRLYLGILEYRARHYIALGFDAKTRAFLKATSDTQLHNMRGWLARCLPFVYDAPPEGAQT